MPPVSEQLGVEGKGVEGRPVKEIFEPVGLSLDFVQEVGSMLADFFLCLLYRIEPLVLRARLLRST